MMDREKPVIALPSSPWEPYPSRTRQLVSRLKGHDVLYLDPPHRGGKNALSGNVNAPGLVIKTLPRPRLFRNGRLARFIAKTAGTCGFDGPVLWVSKPGMAQIARRVPYEGLVYDASEGETDRELAKLADVILVSTAAQQERLGAFGRPVRLIPNGVDFEMFNGAVEQTLPFPNDLFNVQNPIIGHLGAVDENVDLRYVETAAKAHPEWSFVFVGAVRGADTAPLDGLKNVRMLGHKPHKLLPVYAGRFDVCVNIAKKLDSSPIKLYEYLALGKPIVSTPHPAQVLDYTEAVYIAGTHEEFIACCRKAIRERDAWRTRRRIEYGRAAGWDARAAELERMLKELSVF